MSHLRTLFKRGYSLFALIGFLLLLSVTHVPLSSGSALADLSEIAVPLAVLVGLVVCSVRLIRDEYGVDQIERMTRYGWAGTVAAVFGVSWLVWRFRLDLAAPVLFDEVLTVVSLGSGVGVFVGTRAVRENPSPNRPRRYSPLSETVWTTEPEPNPILSAVTAQIAELEGVDPLELPPLYDHVDPDAFSKLREKDDSQWQLLFYTDEYEVRVSSYGTVTIYHADDPDDSYDSTLSSDEGR